MTDNPNILFFHLDNVAQADFGCYGGGVPIGAKTPNIDRFASEGLMLTNYNAEAQCSPSRSALMTGRHSVRTGVVSVLPGCGLVAWELTVADQLKQLGYNNAIYGKWHCGDSEGRYPTDKGFDYWYGIHGTWDVAYWPEDKWFRDAGMKPSHIVESTGQGQIEELDVLDFEARKNFDRTTLDKAKDWMDDSVAKDEPFFVYFNHSQVHFPTLARDEFVDSSNGGEIGDCVQMVDSDFQELLDKIDNLGITDNTIVIFAGDNGRDTTFHAPGNRGSAGNWRGGYFSSYEGNNRTACIVRWPGKVESRATDGMMHLVDWFPTLLNLIGHEELIPTDRVLDGVDQSAFIRGQQDDSNRDWFPMFFGETYVGMRYRNFKVLTHKVATGASPILELATPNVINLTVDPDEDMPFNYDQGGHSWVLYQVYGPKSAEFHTSLKGDAVPKGAPLDFDPKDPPTEDQGSTPIRDEMHHFFHGQSG